MKNIFTICYSREEANEVGHFIMSKGYEGVQNDSYRYCDESIQFALRKNSYHNIDHIYVGVKGCQMIVAQTKRGLRRKGLKYIEKKRVFYDLLEDEGKERSMRATNTITRKADIVLFISSEHPLMQQLQKLFGEDCFMRDFTTIDKNEKYVTLRHTDTGRLVAYTSEDRLNIK